MTSKLKKRIEELERANGAGIQGRVLFPQWEPIPIDARHNDELVAVEFVTGDIDGVVPSSPCLDLEEPLSAEVEQLLADGYCDGKKTYHRWDAETREFVSPYGLRRPAKGKADD